MKIRELRIEHHGNILIVPEAEGVPPFRVTVSYIQRHNPEPGGYFVRYRDGYISYSPANAFEGGYTLIA